MEFKVIEDTPQNVQKLLNQWRHLYDLTIHATFLVDQKMTILVTRTPKDPPQSDLKSPGRTIHIPGSRKEMFKSINAKRPMKLTQDSYWDRPEDPNDPDGKDFPF